MGVRLSVCLFCVGHNYRLQPPGKIEAPSEGALTGQSSSLTCRNKSALGVISAEHCTVQRCEVSVILGVQKDCRYWASAPLQIGDKYIVGRADDGEERRGNAGHCQAGDQPET